MRIVVLDGYTLNPGDNPWDDVTALGELVVYDRTSPEEILDRARGAEILLVNKTPLDASTLAKLPDLRFITVLATGFNVVDVEAARARDIPVSNVPAYGTDAVAQFVFALLLHHCHQVARHNQWVQEGAWSRHFDWCFWEAPTRELAGQTMGIIGFGRIGRRTGEIAHAFGMKVVAADPDPMNPPGYTPFSFLPTEAVFAEADVVSLHCPQTNANTRFVNRRLLGLMKPTAILINTARGGLINERDLAEALNQGVLAAAAVDVVSTEPIRPDNPLLCARNLVVTPHMAWAALAARRRIMSVTADNIRAFLDGQPIHVVNGVESRPCKKGNSRT